MVSDNSLHLILVLFAICVGWTVFGACLHPMSRPIVRDEMHGRMLAGGALAIAATFALAIGCIVVFEVIL